MPDLAVGFHTLPEDFQKVIRLVQDRLNISVAPLQILTGGLSGASIYLVSVASSDPERVEHYILKLDRINEKAKVDEIGRYQLVINHSPPQFASQHIAQMAFERVESEGILAIFYSVAGHSLNQYKTLSAYDMQSQLEAIFAETYRYLLSDWNQARTFQQAVHPQILLEQWLGYRLKPGNQIEKFLDEACRVQPELPGFIIQGRLFPNPYAYAKKLKLWGNSRPLDAAIGLQHGDLNTNNILVKFEKDNKTLEGYYLIDFAMFKESMPLFYDLKYLEISYLILRLSQVSFIKLFELLAHFGEADQVDPLQVPIDVAGVCSIHESARKTFEQWVKDNHPSLHDDLWGQYWLAGVGAGLSFCHKTGLQPEERIAAMVYAAANLKRYMALFGIPNPIEGQQLYDPNGLYRDKPLRVSSALVLNKISNNLPIQPTPFIGRKTQVAAARDLILSENIRLVTFTGPGGTGKTRLSMQVAGELLDEFSSGVYFIPLAETTEIDLAVSKIAQVLEVREGNRQSLLNTLKDYLYDKKMLLILDNFEQLVGAASITADLLAAAPGLKLLISSRIVLNIRGEHEFPVSPLETPDASAFLSALETLRDNESVQLFVQRAQAANPKFAITLENISAVAEICRRLEGLPLAIELAAARIKLLNPQAMVERLYDRLAFLTSGARDLPTRQQTLRNTLDWSHSLLGADERKLFARLGIFVGGFELDAVEHVCNPDQDLDVLAGIESLMNNSLIRQEDDANGRTRFRMLETIREYALEQLEKQAETAVIRRAHGLYYIQTVAVSMGNKLYSSESVAWLNWLETEHDNIRAALVWTEAASEMDDYIPRLILFLSWFWYRRGYFQEGRAWAERFLAKVGSAPGTLGRASTLLGSSMLALWRGDTKTALVEAEESVATLTRLENEQFIPYSFMTMGVIHVNRGNDMSAHPLLKEASELFQETGQDFFYAVSLVHLGNVSLGLGNADEARGWLEKAYKIAQRVGDPWANSFALNNLGEVARVQGDFAWARRYYEESELLLRMMGDKGDLARLIHSLGYVALHEGDIDKARQQFGESLALFRKLGNKRGIAECLMGLAGLIARDGHSQRAALFFGAAEALLAESGAAWWPADRIEVDRNREMILSALGENDFAVGTQNGRSLSLEQVFGHAIDENP